MDPRVGDIVAVTRGPGKGRHATVRLRLGGAGNLIVAVPGEHDLLVPEDDVLAVMATADVTAILGVRFITSTAEHQFLTAAFLGGATLTEAQAEQIRGDVEDAIAKVKRRFIDHRVSIRWLHNLAEPRPVVVVIREHRGNADSATALELIWTPASAADFLRREARIPAVAGSPPPLAPCGGRHADRASSRPQDQRTRQKPKKRTRK